VHNHEGIISEIAVERQEKSLDMGVNVCPSPPAQSKRSRHLPHRAGAGVLIFYFACIKASSSSRRCGNVESRVLCDFPHFHNEPGAAPWVRFGFYPFYRCS
jgi:hypothetical protein